MRTRFKDIQMRKPLNSKNLKGRLAVVLGAGRSGLSAASLLCSLGAQTRLLERNPDFDAGKLSSRGLEKVELILGEHKREHFQGADLTIVSPGIPWSTIQNLLAPRGPVFSELELASWFVSDPVIALTGTNGKTTTCMLIGHCLEKSWRWVFTGGNIGTPLSDYVLSGRKTDVLVLEASSFQLQGCASFRPDVGVLLNFSANHLDHHKNEEEYFQAKLRLFDRQAPEDLAVLPKALKSRLENSRTWISRTTFFASKDRFNCPALPGAHNQDNLEAAYASCSFMEMKMAEFERAILDFQPPAHRQEVFLKSGGVTFINDSKATTVEAMAAALNAFKGPIRLLAGGVYKGGDYALLIPLIRDKVAKVYLFGAGREVFESAWQDKVAMRYCSRLEEAVTRALDDAGPGDFVLLAPGTSSFDQFVDYRARGSAFKQAVFRHLNITGSSPENVSLVNNDQPAQRR